MSHEVIPSITNIFNPKISSCESACQAEKCEILKPEDGMGSTEYFSKSSK